MVCEACTIHSYPRPGSTPTGTPTVRRGAAFSRAREAPLSENSTRRACGPRLRTLGRARFTAPPNVRVRCGGTGLGRPMSGSPQQQTHHCTAANRRWGPIAESRNRAWCSPFAPNARIGPLSAAWRDSSQINKLSESFCLFWASATEPASPRAGKRMACPVAQAACAGSLVRPVVRRSSVSAAVSSGRLKKYP
jgi:hypothetical protein